MVGNYMDMIIYHYSNVAKIHAIAGADFESNKIHVEMIRNYLLLLQLYIGVFKRCYLVFSKRDFDNDRNNNINSNNYPQRSKITRTTVSKL